MTNARIIDDWRKEDDEYIWGSTLSINSIIFYYERRKEEKAKKRTVEKVAEEKTAKIKDVKIKVLHAAWLDKGGKEFTPLENESKPDADPLPLPSPLPTVTNAPIQHMPNPWRRPPGNCHNTYLYLLYLGLALRTHQPQFNYNNFFPQAPARGATMDNHFPTRYNHAQPFTR